MYTCSLAITNRHSLLVRCTLGMLITMRRKVMRGPKSQMADGFSKLGGYLFTRIKVHLHVSEITDKVWHHMTVFIKVSVCLHSTENFPTLM